jgi:RHS repeat-associated protein
MNTNRTKTSFVPTSGTTINTDSCYNTADQITTTITGATTTTDNYDSHGNQTNDNGTALTWDASDRLTTSTTPAGVVTTYGYDQLNRVISRTTGTTVTRYAYAGYTDSPAATLTSTNQVSQRLVTLPGGVTETMQASGNIWSYPDLHGNTTVTTTNTGTRQGNPDTYDPWGTPTVGQTPVNNVATNGELGAFGTAGKITDTNTGIIIMGARPYNPTEARFLTVDPITGGCANPYTYAYGDPINGNDLTGQSGCGGDSPDPYEVGLTTLGLLAGVVAAATGVGAVFATSEAATQALALTSLITGSAAAAADAKTCIGGHFKNTAACTGLVLGAGSLIAAGADSKAGEAEPNSGAAVSGLGVVAIKLGLASALVDVVTGVGDGVCGILGVINTFANGLGNGLSGGDFL